MKRDVLDVEVEVAFKRRVDGGIRRTARRHLRLVAVRLPESSDYRFYLTYIDPDSLDAHGVAQSYAARWQSELIFKELKSHYRLDELPTRKAHIVETLRDPLIFCFRIDAQLTEHAYRSKFLATLPSADVGV